MSVENNEQRQGFKKGRSGNPGGRPKGYNAFRKAFRKVEDVNAIRAKLMALILGDEANAAIAAAKLWLEYGFGKTPAAPEDNDALRESGMRLPANLTAEQTLAIARGEKPE